MSKTYDKVIRGKRTNTGVKSTLNIHGRGTEVQHAYPDQKKNSDRTGGANGGGKWRKK